MAKQKDKSKLFKSVKLDDIIEKINNSDKLEQIKEFELFIPGDVVVSKDSSDKSEQIKEFESFESFMNSSNNSKQFVLEHDHEKGELKTFKIFHDPEEFKVYFSNKIQKVKTDSVKISEDTCLEANTANDILHIFNYKNNKITSEILTSQTTFEPFNHSNFNLNSNEETQSQTETSKDIQINHVKLTNN